MSSRSMVAKTAAVLSYVNRSYNVRNAVPTVERVQRGCGKRVSREDIREIVVRAGFDLQKAGVGNERIVPVR